MRNKLSLSLTAILVTAVILGLAPTIRASPPPAPSFYVLPETITFTPNNASVGTLFNVTLWGSVAVPTTAWNAKLGFNATMLQAVAIGYTAGSTSQFFSGHATVPGLPSVVDNTAGSVLWAEALSGITDSVGPASGSLMYITFNITLAPAPGAKLTCNIDPGFGVPSDDTYFLDTTPEEETGLSTAYCIYTFSTPPVSHDVAVNSITPSSSQVLQNASLTINVVALNNGTVTETFDVNVTYDGTLIGTQTVNSLSPGNTQTLSFSWDTTGVPLGNYTLTATAAAVPGETDFSNNAKTAQVQVSTRPAVSYDLNHDGKVDVKDIFIAAQDFGSTPGSPRWHDGRSDVSGPNGVPDGKVDIWDVAAVARHFGHPA